MPLESIRFESKIVIENIPIEWLSYRFNFCDVEFPQFPFYYIHVFCNDKRIYGFPVLFNMVRSEGRSCDVEVVILTNVDLTTNDDYLKTVKLELEHRIGSAEKIGIDDIVRSCNGNVQNEIFFKALWPYISHVYGDVIPFGRFYEGVDSIVRFVSAWQPKTGRQSEIRMRYNFFSAFGENIKIEGKFSFFQFSLLPTVQDILGGNYEQFPKYKILNTTIDKIWDKYYDNDHVLNGREFHSMSGRAWPISKDDFIEEVSKPLEAAGVIIRDERYSIERLVDAFNRHSWRAAFYIWSIVTMKTAEYHKWNKDDFIAFYSNEFGVGLSEKVVACFLQQGFSNAEAIPIDTWVEAFHEHVLAIPTKNEFFNSFSSLGKLERVIWLSSQANKINLKAFFNLMWCTRYGTTGNSELRGANPISCYECDLKNACPGFQSIANKSVKVVDEAQVALTPSTTAKGKINGIKLTTNAITRASITEGCFFICVTSDSIPKKIFKKVGQNWMLYDEFSGFILKNQRTALTGQTVIVRELVESLPLFEFEE